MLELEHSLAFHVEDSAEFLTQLPARPAVCLIEPREAAAAPLLIRTQDLRRRLQRLLGPDDPTSKRLNLREFARGVQYRVTGSAFEQTLAYYHNAKRVHPGRYRDLLRMRPPAVLKVNLKNAYPRCYVTRRIAVNAEGEPISGAYYGPFRKRKVAERFAESVLDFFKVRRCQIKIRRDPTFPGCIYSEMKMCLAPCFAGCSQEEYGAEVQRLVQFLDTGGDSLRGALEKERERASEELDFEKASTLHKRLEKIDDALRGGPELARRVTDINAVILQRGAEEQTIAAFALRGGYIAEPLVVRFAEMASAPKSVEQIFREYLEPAKDAEEGANYRAPTAGTPARTRDSKELSEHLWILARWFYGKPRDGEIFFFTESGRQPGWPYRRILRACSRLLAPPEDAAKSGDAAPAQPKASETSTEQKPASEGAT